MATTAAHNGGRARRFGKQRAPAILHWSVSGATVGLLAWSFAEGSFDDFAPITFIAWTAAVLVADLMVVRLGKGVLLSMSLPVLLAAAMLFEPAVAALIGFVACLDPGEIRGEVGLERAFFNRSQVALSVGLASAAMASLGMPLKWPTILVVAAVGFATDSLVNVALVTSSTVLSGRGSIRETAIGLLGAEPAASGCLYAMVALMAPVFALIYLSWGIAALVLCTGLLIPIRLALVRIQELQRATTVASLRQAALARAEETADREREDERKILAGDLHDEVLPALFKVHLMGEVLKQDLASGRLLDLDDDLPELLDATNAAQAAVRGVVVDLRHRRAQAPDVVGAIRGWADELEGDGRPRIELRLEEVDGSDVSLRTLIQVAREAMTNSSRYSMGTRIRVDLKNLGTAALLFVADDGGGFDPGAVDQSAHFGLQLMNERVMLIGGTLSLSSSALGTEVTAEVPLDVSLDAQN